MPTDNATTDVADTVFDAPIDVVVVKDFARDGTCDPVTYRFAGIADIRAEFDLHTVEGLDEAIVDAARTGTAHVCVCPYASEMNDHRELLVQDSLDKLRLDHEDSCDML